MVRRLVRRTIGMVVVFAALGAAIRVGRAILRRRAADAGPAPIRTGSFDSWPTVPTAPGRSATGA
jgi:hypothetical protein